MATARCQEKSYKCRDVEDACHWYQCSGSGARGGHGKVVVGAMVVILMVLDVAKNPLCITKMKILIHIYAILYMRAFKEFC